MTDRTHIRYRIVGQGLVGTLLALAMDEAGLPFIVQSVNLSGESTSIAPGIVNPLAGRKFRPPSDIDDLLQSVQRMVQLAEKRLDAQLWNTSPILRVFQDPAQAERMRASASEEGRSPYISAFYEPGTFPHINDSFGSFLTVAGGWMNLPLLKMLANAWLDESGRLLETPFTPDQTQPDEVVIFCEGWQVSRNPEWSFIPHSPAKGQMLIVRFKEDFPRSHVINHHCWAQPIVGGLWRVGATYSWSDFDGNASLEGTTDLCERLDLMTSIRYEVLDSVAGVRPIVEDYLPVIGNHPQRPEWMIINAMGSKGVLQTPAAVEHLVAFLCNGTPIPKKWSVERFLG